MAAVATIRISLPARSGAANAVSSDSAGRDSRMLTMERRALASGAIDGNRAFHPFDDLVGYGEPETRAAESSGRAAVRLFEFEENTGLILQRDTDAGVAHRDRDCIRSGAGFDDDRDAAAFGELDRVAGEVEQGPAQPRRIADDVRRQPFVDIAANLEPLGLRARPAQLDHLIDERSKRKRPRRKVEPAGFDLEKSRASSISDNSVSPVVFTAFK
jgi:hypothetical protein